MSHIDESRNSLDTQTPSAIPGRTSLNSGSIQPPYLGQRRTESAIVLPETVVLPESSSATVAAKLNLARPTVGQAFITDIESDRVSTKPAEHTPDHESVSVPRPVVSRNDVVVPAGQTQATLNVTRSDSNESTPALSDQLATAITETLANVADDGPTTVRIRLDRRISERSIFLSVTKTTLFRFGSDRQSTFAAGC